MITALQTNSDAMRSWKYLCYTFSYAGMIRQVRGSGLRFAHSQPACADPPKIDLSRSDRIIPQEGRAVKHASRLAPQPQIPLCFSQLFRRIHTDDLLIEGRLVDPHPSAGRLDQRRYIRQVILFLHIVVLQP